MFSARANSCARSWTHAAAWNWIAEGPSVLRAAPPEGVQVRRLPVDVPQRWSPAVVFSLDRTSVRFRPKLTF